MIERITLETFKDTKALSFSRLSKLADGPKIYKASLEEDKSSSGLTFGSLVDTLLTNPDNFNNEFYVMTADKPDSPLMSKFCEVYAQTYNSDEAYKASGFKISLGQVLSKFNTEGRAYYDALVFGKDKKVVDSASVFAAQQAVNMLKTNEFTSKYFDREQGYKGIDIYFQVPIIWKSWVTKLPYTHPENPEEIEVTFKGLLDVVVFDNHTKTIEIIDVKTGAEGFFKAFWKYRLYLQGGMYYYGLDKLICQAKMNDWIVKPTKFVYIDSNLFNQPVIYKMTKSDVYHSRIGYYPKIYGPNDPNIAKLKFKGYETLAAELDWHIRNDKWDYSYDIYMNNGEVEIDAFNPKF